MKPLYPLGQKWIEYRIENGFSPGTAAGADFVIDTRYISMLHSVEFQWETQ